MKDCIKSTEQQTGFAEKLALTRDVEETGLMNSCMAHDFNNILATIMGYTELLQELLAHDKNGSIHQYLNEIHVCVGRAYDLIGDVSKHAKSCHGKSNSA